ncbi:MAG: GntR family transcriptional regulator [Dongiaceae bacterium]
MARPRRSPERTPEPIAARSLTELAVETIRNRILDLTLRPGMRIDEKLLMERFQLSRTPAREALNRLVAEGLVEMQANKGTFVRPLDVGQVAQFFDAYHVAEKMIGFFCRFTDVELGDDLRHLQSEHEQAVRRRRYLDITRLNAQFHGRIARASRNEYVEAFSGRLHNHARRLSYFVYHMEAADTGTLGEQQVMVAGEHNTIIDCIGNADRRGLISVLGQHSARFQDRIMRFVNSRRGLEFPL